MPSKYAELVEQETEPDEEPETEPDEEPDAEEAEEEEQPESSAAAVAAAPFDERKLERELRRHEKAMRELLGDGWQDMQPCPECATAGFVPSGWKPMLPVPEAIECPGCNGYGLRITHSRREGNETEMCFDCQGRGWTDRRSLEAAQAAASYQAIVSQQPPQPEQPPQPRWNAMTQTWETPDGQPIYVPTSG